MDKRIKNKKKTKNKDAKVRFQLSELSDESSSNDK